MLKFTNAQPVSPEYCEQVAEVYRDCCLHEVIATINRQLCQGERVITVDLDWARVAGWQKDVCEDLKDIYEAAGWELFIKEFTTDAGFVKINFNSKTDQD